MLNIDHVVKNYSDFRLDVTMEVKPGCITGLVGRNGAGKSTTFKAILNLICPESGSVQVLGTDSRHLGAKEREELGVVLADSGFSEYLTVRDIDGILKTMYRKYDSEYFIEQCARLGLTFMQKTIRSLLWSRAALTI